MPMRVLQVKFVYKMYVKAGILPFRQLNFSFNVLLYLLGLRVWIVQDLAQTVMPARSRHK